MNATPPVVTVTRRQATVIIYQGDYPARLDDLAARVDDARNAAVPARLGGKASKSAAMQLAEEYDALVAEAQASGVKITVQALPRREWRGLKDKHPPRDGNEDDEAAGANTATLFDDANPACIIDGIDPAHIDTFLDNLSDADWQQLSGLVFEVNERPTRIPKSSAVSLLKNQKNDDSE